MSTMTLADEPQTQLPIEFADEKESINITGFWYSDHSLTVPENVESMRQIRGDLRGIPVIVIDGETLVGFNRRRLSTLLGLY